MIARLRHERWLDVAVAFALAAVAAALRIEHLGPPSLWLDDAWVALVTKAGTVHEFLLTSGTAPGFSAVLKGWLALVGFSETNAQLLPFAFGIAIPAIAYLAFVTRGVGRLGAGAGAFVLVVSPILITHSARVKQFTLDTVCSLVLLVLAWRLLDDVGSKRRWWYLALTGMVAVVLSSPSALILVSGIGVGLLRLWQERRSALAVASIPVTVAAAFVATWWWIVLRPVGNETLRGFWDGYFFTFDEGLIKAFLRAGRIAWEFFQGAVPLKPYFGAVVVISAFALVLSRSRFVGLLLITPFAIAVMLAALQYAPLGTGRTDAYLYPVLALAIALAVEHLQARAFRVAVAGVLALAIWTLVAAARGDHSYPEEDVASLVAKVEEVVPPSDAILVYHDTNFAFALYTSWPIEFVSTHRQPMGFQAPVLRPNVFTLEPHDEDPQSYAAVIGRIRSSYDTVWLAASHTPYRTDFPYIEKLLRQNYTKKRTFSWSGASLTRWSSK